MRSPASLASASGLRPLSAFVVIAAVVLVVAGRVASVSAERDAGQPVREVREVGKPPAFEIEDATGRVIARCVPRFDLLMSPRSMWQAHTPERIALALSDVLGGVPTASDLLDAMVPDARGGTIEVERWNLTARQAYLLEEWIAGGAGSGRGRLAGIFVERASDDRGARPPYRIYWKPALLLSQQEREHHGYASAWAWARHLAAGIARCAGTGTDGSAGDDPFMAVWEALLPSGFCRPVRGVPSERVLQVRELLRQEGISPWQMCIAYENDRVYPCGSHELFGSWGFTRPEQTEPEARDGLELLSRQLLTGDEWSFLGQRPPTYTWLQDRAVRGERSNGFLDYQAGSNPISVRSTIDLALMECLRRELQELMTEHQPALAMGIVLDVASGEVLAVDSLEAYEVQPFAPVYHAFTPGSTFKVVTMSVALEERAVTPEQRFDVGAGEYVLVDPQDGRTRTIHEAEGSLTGVITASEALAYSVNAGLVQVGVRVPAPAFRAYLEPLGYGQPPGAGLGIEKAGYLRPLPWKLRFTHASVSFGHELTTTLWQHAAALATVIRGGEHRPLSVVHAVTQDGREHPVPAAPGTRVFSERTCLTVGEMLASGAREGTGAEAGRRFLQLARGAGFPEAELEDFQLGTKTGTAQKVPSELCLHVEQRERQRCRALGIPWTEHVYRSLKGAPMPHRSCYTSSTCVVACRPDDGRRLMVLIVADEPCGKEKYGARVAGATAVDVLAEALGFTREGRLLEPELLAGFGASRAADRNPVSEPWRVGAF